MEFPDDFTRCSQSDWLRYMARYDVDEIDVEAGSTERRHYSNGKLVSVVRLNRKIDTFWIPTAYVTQSYDYDEKADIQKLVDHAARETLDAIDRDALEALEEIANLTCRVGTPTFVAHMIILFSRQSHNMSEDLGPFWEDMLETMFGELHSNLGLIGSVQLVNQYNY